MYEIAKNICMDRNMCYSERGQRYHAGEYGRRYDHLQGLELVAMKPRKAYEIKGKKVVPLQVKPSLSNVELPLCFDVLQLFYRNCLLAQIYIYR